MNLQANDKGLLYELEDYQWRMTARKKEKVTWLIKERKIISQCSL